MKTEKKAVVEAKRAILNWLDYNDPFRSEGPHVPAKIRGELGLEKGVFDQAVLDLFRERLVYCAPHDHAGRLTESERERLVFDGRIHYCSISDRRPVRLPAEPLPAC